MNTFGDKLRFTSFGESHGIAVGGVLDGFPSGVNVNFDYIRHEAEDGYSRQNKRTIHRGNI